MQDIYAILDQLGITYVKHEHPPLFSVKEAEAYDRKIPGMKTKNLFLKGKSGYFLVVMDAFKRLDMKALGGLLNDKFSFASEADLKEYLGLSPGAVSPFGLVNDKNKAVTVIVDQDIWGSEITGFHPNVNTATLEITVADFKKFLDSRGNKVQNAAL